MAKFTIGFSLNGSIDVSENGVDEACRVAEQLLLTDYVQKIKEATGKELSIEICEIDSDEE